MADSLIGMVLTVDLAGIAIVFVLAMPVLINEKQYDMVMPALPVWRSAFL